VKASVLIPAYQAGEFIAGALESVRAQTHSNWELIVVEDGSNDRTREQVDRFAVSTTKNVVYFNLGENRGVAAARNRLLELAQGDALAFLDADDTWEPDHLRNAVAEFKAGAELVVSGVQTTYLDGRRGPEVIVPPPALERNPVLTLFRKSAIVTSSAVVLTRTLSTRTGIFDRTFSVGEDRDYWLRCALAGGRFRGTSTVSCRYTKHAASSMAQTQNVALQATRFYEKHFALTAVPARLRRHLLADSLITVGRLLRQSDPERSAASLRRAWHCEPFNLKIPFHLACTNWRTMSPARAA